MLFIDRVQARFKAHAALAGFSIDSKWTSRFGITLWRTPVGSGVEAEHRKARRAVIVPGFGDTPLSWITMTHILKRKEFIATNFTEIVILEYAGYVGDLGNRTLLSSAELLMTATNLVLNDLSPQLLIGQSMGGFLSSVYAIQRQQAATATPSLEHLVLLCPSGLTTHESIQNDWDEIRAALTTGQVELFLKRAVHFSIRYPHLYAFKTPILNGFRVFLEKHTSVALLNSFNQSHNLDGKIQSLRTPITLIWGASDKLIPFETYSEWVRILSMGNAHAFHKFLIPHATHALHAEEPFQIAEEIVKNLRFL